MSEAYAGYVHGGYYSGIEVAMEVMNDLSLRLE